MGHDYVIFFYSRSESKTMTMNFSNDSSLLSTIKNQNTSGLDEHTSDDITEHNNQNAKLLLPVMITVGVLLVVGIIGNALVFYVYYYKNRTTKRTFIIALAVLDLVNCVFTMPFEIYDMRNQYNFSSMEACKVFRSLETALVLSSGFTLIAVAVDRYIQICVKTSRVFFTPGRAKIICWICVLIGALFSWPVVLFSGTEDIPISHRSHNITGSECTYFRDNAHKHLNSKLYTLILFVVFVTALIIMISSYCMIGTKLYHRRRGSMKNGLVYLHEAPGNQRPHEGSVTDGSHSCGYAISKKGVQLKGSTVIFFSVTFVFVIGFLPHLVVRILRFADIAFQDNTGMDSNEVVYNFLIRSFLINNAANPFIYSIFHKRFRQDVVKTFRKLTLCHLCEK